MTPGLLVPPGLLRAAILTASAALGGWLAWHEPGVADAVAYLAAAQHHVASPEAGRLVELPVELGQRVRQGQLLARIDTAVLEREIAVAEAALRQSQSAAVATVATLEAGGFATERSFRDDLDQAGAALESAQAQAARERNELQVVRQEAARWRQLAAEGLARADRAEEWERQSRTLEGAVALWPGRLAQMEERRAAAARRLDELRARYQVSSTPETRQARERPLADRSQEFRESVQVLRTRLRNARIVAPADGEVVTLSARRGDIARAGEPFLTLNVDGAHQLIAYVRERDGDWLKPGDQAWLRRRGAARDESHSTITRVGSQMVQLPMRFWPTPATPQWGREVFLKVPSPLSATAGEAFDVRFTPGGS